MSGARGPFDAETLVIAWLDGRLAAGVSTKLPADLEDAMPHLTVRRVGSSFVDGTGRLERVRLDLDAYAATDFAAFELVASAIAEVLELDEARFAHDAGVITDARVDLGPINLPDPDTGTEHYLATVAVYGHRKTPAGSGS
jgi:hypothetical protein